MTKMRTLSEQLAPYSRPMYSPYDPDTGEGLERPEPTAAEILDEYAAPSRAATHAYGVVFRADHETEDDGMCRQARLHARALARYFPVCLQSIGHRVRHGSQSFSNAGDDLLSPRVWQEVGELRHTTIRNVLVTVYHTLCSQATKGLLTPDYLRFDLGAADRVLARAIVYTPWERSVVSPEIIEVLKRCGQVWLQCERNRAVFVASGLPKEKTRLIPNAYDPSGAVPEIARISTVPPGKRFYSIGKWEPRKNQHGLVGAFLSTFRPKDSASLTIKTSHFGNWRDYPSPRDSVAHWLGKPQVKSAGWTAENVTSRLFILEGTLPEDRIVALHRMNNIYVSASHAEGWDYPAFDAKTAGNALVHVGFGGTEDYADESDVPLAWSGLEPVHEGYGWEPGAQWAAYDIEELCRCLRYAKAPERRYFRDDLAQRFGVNAAGREMRRAVEDLVTENDPLLAKQIFGRLDQEKKEQKP